MSTKRSLTVIHKRQFINRFMFHPDTLSSSVLKDASTLKAVLVTRPTLCGQFSCHGRFWGYSSVAFAVDMIDLERIESISCRVFSSPFLKELKLPSFGTR